MPYNMISLFAGIGGIDLGFQQAGINPIWANEIDQYAAMTFQANHPRTQLVIDDINNIHAQDIPCRVDILAGGFPCQPFSIAGYQRGFNDDRGNLFFSITRLIRELQTLNRQPRVVFLENVKNLLTHNNGNTFARIQQELQELGYFVFARVLNSKYYGNVPQNRERVFIICFLDPEAENIFQWPDELPLTNVITNVVDWNAQVNQRYYYTPNVQAYPLLQQNVIQHNVIYQYRRVYVRANQGGVCPTLTANMGMGGHNVPIILDNMNRIRKLTPRECLLLQGFPQDFIIPQQLCDSRIYKQAGNSVSVPVIRRLAERIKMTLEAIDGVQNN